MKAPLLAGAIVVVIGLGAAGCGGGEEEITLGLITKQEANPFFVEIREVAEDTASDVDAELLTAAGETDVDHASQVAALEDMAERGAEGILIIPADSEAIVAPIERARREGIIVVALDTPTEPESAVHALYATDNRRAGRLIGRYARARAEEEGIEPRIAMLDLAPGISVGELRREGFLEGFGIEEDDPQLVASAFTEGDQARAREGMQQLLREHPDINLVYTINEPVAFGAADSLEAAGKDDDEVIVVSIDGSCTAVMDWLRPGRIDATAQQYPENMARLGIETVARAVRGGPAPRGYTDTGVEIITDDPVDAVETRDVPFGVRNCWG